MSFHILEQGGQALTNFQIAQIHEPDSPARELKTWRKPHELNFKQLNRDSAKNLKTTK